MTVARSQKAEQALGLEVMRYARDPLGFVRFAFDWGSGALIGEKGPRAWQVNELEAIRRSFEDGTIGVRPYRAAVASGHGSGKSALVAWLILWAMSTGRDCNCVVTATTEQQLRTKTWAELGKWYNLMINRHWFVYTATKLYFAEKAAEETWKAEAVTWSSENPIAFQGLHNLGRRILVVFDEASGIDDVIWDVTEGALTDERTEILWVAFGNPNLNTGRFDACWKRYRRLWRRTRIDTRKVEGVSRKQIAEWASIYGEDSDFFRVRVRGLPPRGAGGNLIGEEMVERALERRLEPRMYDFAPLVIGVDPAWTGEDSLEVVARQGSRAWSLMSLPKNDDDVAVANRVAEFEDALGADAVFLDAGYGTGIYSVGKSQNRNWKLVWFSEKTFDEECVNKRAEMWKSVRDWIRDGGWLDCRGDAGLAETWKMDLVSVGRKDRPDGKILLKSKQEMRKEGLASPNMGDALALTFAEPVLKASNSPANIVFEAECWG